MIDVSDQWDLSYLNQGTIKGITGISTAGRYHSTNNFPIKTPKLRTNGMDYVEKD